MQRLDTVAIIASNIAEMIEAHFAVLMLGAVLNPINTDLMRRPSLSPLVKHGQAKVFIVDGEHARVAKEALAQVRHAVDVIDIGVPGQSASPIGAIGYEALLATGDPDFAPNQPTDEWQSLCLLYTSGTTGDPKGAVYQSPGRLFVGNGQRAHVWANPRQHLLVDLCRCSIATVGPSFCAVIARGGTQVCLRKVELGTNFPSDRQSMTVTHLCGAPIVLQHDRQVRPLMSACQLRIRCAAPPAAPPRLPAFSAPWKQSASR